MIHVHNLSKTFHASEKVEAIKNIEIDLEKGDIFGIIGMSGAGKSTLLRCIALLEEPTSGEIFIDGKNILTLKGKELLQLRQQVGVIFQGYHLLMQRTVWDNIAFPLEISHRSKTEIKTRVDELLQLVGLQDKAKAYPAELSGGQKQRVAIARALANHPQILLCDEPTSALDSLTTKSILSLLQKINQELNVTILIITHEIGVVKSICHKVAVIDAGQFVEVGEASQVLTCPKHAVTKLLLGVGGESAC